MFENHPLAELGLYVRNYKCFGSERSGFDQFLPINVIIGRNNSGKSSLNELLDVYRDKGQSYRSELHDHKGQGFELTVQTKLTEPLIRTGFVEGTRGGTIPMEHLQYGERFIGNLFEFSLDKSWNVNSVSGKDFEVSDMDRSHFVDIAHRFSNSLPNISIVSVSAERDVVPETASATNDLKPNGGGVTNQIRRFITSQELPRSEVEVELLKDLNHVYAGDSQFNRIVCQQNEDQNLWEIFLEEEEKGDVRLSQSGSSLKSVFLILSMLRLYPLLNNFNWDQAVFCLEEPENNLHPALLRRLLDKVADYRDRLGFMLNITTHSPIAIDWAARREESQIIHVTHNGNQAQTTTSQHYTDNAAILDDLDVRASDLLQANGIIWVEGPTDRIYLRRWIELHTRGEIREGTHYSIMFYGGRLLSHLDALPPGERGQYISLLSVNRNIALVLDSDRHNGSNQSKGKPRVRLNDKKRG